MIAAIAILYLIVAALVVREHLSARLWLAEQDKVRLRLEALERGELPFRFENRAEELQRLKARKAP